MHKEILPLTSLRFVAALYVFLFHFQIYWHLLLRGGLGRFLTEGACGMSVFFILSGCVLGYRFHAGVSNYKSYAFKRFARIYPAYFLAGLVTLPWLTLSLVGIHAATPIHYIFLIFMNLIMLQAWIPQVFAFWNIGGSWSLSTEMFFYALFPFLINQFKNLTPKQLSCLLLITYLTCALPGFSFILFPANANYVIFYAMPIFRVSEFIIGVVCGLFIARGYRVAHPNACALLCMAQLYCYLAKGPDFGYTAITHNFMIVPLLAVLMVSLASLTEGGLYRFMTNPVFLYLGRISYSFYSFQALIIMVTITHHAKIVKMFPALDNAYTLMAVSFVILVSIASLSYYFVETRFKNYLVNKYYARNSSKLFISTEAEALA